MTPQQTPPVVASVGEIVDRVRQREPGLGPTRLVLIDGPAGSGKTSLAESLARAFASSDAVQVLHADDMYEGWGGLPTLDAVLMDQVLTHLVAGEPGAFRKWDWHRGERGDRVEVHTPAVLVVEGVGVGMRRARALASLVVWVEATPAERLRRGLTRDGEQLRDEWLRWQRVEQAEFAREGTRAEADVHVDGERSLQP